MRLPVSSGGWCRGLFVCIGCLCGFFAAHAELRPKPLTIEVDARDLPRKLLHSRISIPSNSGKVDLWFPKWVPGIHAPAGPVQNIGGIRMQSFDGKPVTWKRDDEEMGLFHCEVPEGALGIHVDLDYICSQPTTNSIGVDSYGNSMVGVIDWNTCLLYPADYSYDDLPTTVSLRLPAGWKYATALRTEKEENGVVTFASMELDEVVDSPLICGEHLRTYPLDKQQFKPAFLHVVSEAESGTNFKDDLIAKYDRVVGEAGELFGSAPFDEYHFLLVCSDDLPSNGLEHQRSSLNGVGERDLQEEDGVKGWPGYLLPHEFAHAWCGKYRRPAGMTVSDFHTPCHTELLWIYEGLTQYLGEVMCVRSGLWDLEHLKASQAGELSYLKHQTGRQWRSLEDTAVDSANLRGRGGSWSGMRRGQDYYVEGKFLWLEIDAIIRDETDGAKSLDDFCRAFFASDAPNPEPSPYTLEDVYAALNAVAPYDWKSFVESRVETQQETLPLEVVSRVGYRLQFANEPSDYMKKREEDRQYVSALESLGMDAGEDGKIGGNVAPGGAADEAGLAPGSTIIGVNGRKFSLQRMRDGIKDSVSRGNIELLVLDGDVYRTVTVAYADGVKYLEMVRDEGKPDLLAEIYAAKVKE